MHKVCYNSLEPNRPLTSCINCSVAQYTHLKDAQNDAQKDAYKYAKLNPKKDKVKHGEKNAKYAKNDAGKSAQK